MAPQVHQVFPIHPVCLNMALRASPGPWGRIRTEVHGLFNQAPYLKPNWAVRVAGVHGGNSSEIALFSCRFARVGFCFFCAAPSSVPPAWAKKTCWAFKTRKVLLRQILILVQESKNRGFAPVFAQPARRLKVGFSCRVYMISCPPWGNGNSRHGGVCGGGSRRSWLF